MLFRIGHIFIGINTLIVDRYCWHKLEKWYYVQIINNRVNLKNKIKTIYCVILKIALSSFLLIFSFLYK